MKLALLQLSAVPGAFRENTEKLLRGVEQAQKAGADICLAPVFALSGDLLVPFSSKYFAENAQKLLFEQLESIAGKLPIPLLVGSLVPQVQTMYEQGTGWWKEVFLLADGSCSSVLRSPLTSGNGYFSLHSPKIESGAVKRTRFFAPEQIGGNDTRSSLVQIKNKKLFCFCYEELCINDTFNSQFTAEELEHFASPEFDACIGFAAVRYSHQRLAADPILNALKKHTLSSPLLFVNMAGANDGKVFLGASSIYSKNMQCLAKATAVDEDFLQVSLDDLLQRKNYPFFEPMKKEEGVWKALCRGFTSFMQNSGFKKVVLGLSGGLDSALVAALAVECLGPENVSCVMMPSVYSSEESARDSGALLSSLGLDEYSIQIQSLLEAYQVSFSQCFGEDIAGLAEENIQARIRGTLLMAFSNQYGAILLATSNKSELAVGYCTLYGDMNGSILPLGDLYKTEVFALARWINSHKGREYIPVSIIEKEPSAELRFDQKDTDSLPNYEVLDAILYALIEKDMGLNELDSLAVSKEELQKVQKLVRGAEFKRRQAAMVLQLSAKPLTLLPPLALSRSNDC